MLKPIENDQELEAVLEELSNDIHFDTSMTDRLRLVFERQNLCIRYLMKRVHYNNQMPSIQNNAVGPERSY